MGYINNIECSIYNFIFLKLYFISISSFVSLLLNDIWSFETSQASLATSKHSFNSHFHFFFDVSLINPSQPDISILTGPA